MNRKKLGELGEGVARDYLQKLGYRIRETNFRCREGEIDIVAEHGEYLVFVEVRTRASSAFGSPEESVTGAKKDKLVSLAFTYLQTHSDLPSLWRIDVVVVEVGQDSKVSRVELIENAIN